MAVAQQAEARYKVRRPRRSRSRPDDDAASGRDRQRGNSESLPGWNDLAKSNQRQPGTGRSHSFLERISTKRFALLIVGTAILFTLYIGHVHATQDLAAEVQLARRENLRLHLKYNRLKGEFDRMIGPAVIYDRARGIGLIEDPAFGPTILVDE